MKSGSVLTVAVVAFAALTLSSVSAAETALPQRTEAAGALGVWNHIAQTVTLSADAMALTVAVVERSLTKHYRVFGKAFSSSYERTVVVVSNRAANGTIMSVRVNLTGVSDGILKVIAEGIQEVFSLVTRGIERVTSVIAPRSDVDVCRTATAGEFRAR